VSWTYLLCDKDSDAELADLTEWSLTKKISARLNRPLSTVLTIPGDTAAIRDSSFDGRPNLEVGRRTIKAYQDGVLRGHTLVWNIGPSGDENQTSVMVTGYDPMMLLPKRLVQESDGTFANPQFASPITGAEILQQVIDNTVSNDGPLPIDTSGAISSSTDLAADLTNWPTTIGDLFTMLTDTGVLDVQMAPVDTHTGFPAGIMAQLLVADELGADLTDSVHFDYATGDFSVANIRRSFDMDELCNKLWYYLGPRIDDTHYRGNITATEAGLETYAALQLASRDLYGVYMDARIYDDTDVESDARPLFHRLWKTEVQLRVNPRELLYVQPAAGDGCPFRPFIDYNPGDRVSVNAADIVGPAIDGAVQRIYGFDVDEDQDGIERASELIVSAADE
jgi:hypothetical protein